MGTPPIKPALGTAGAGYPRRGRMSYRGAPEVTVSRKPDQDQLQAAAKEAKSQGKRPSEVGATQGASKQIDHHTKSERSQEGTPRGGKS
jgi:hypothetical protein